MLAVLRTGRQDRLRHGRLEGALSDQREGGHRGRSEGQFQASAAGGAGEPGKELMQFYRNLPIKWKLMLIIMLTSSIAVVLACAAFIGYESVQLPRAPAAAFAPLAEIEADHS